MSSHQETLESPLGSTPEDVLQLMQQRIIHLEEALHQTQIDLNPVTGHITTHGKEPKISSPAAYTGRKEDALEFLLKCDMVFDVQPKTYSTEKSKIAFVTNLLKDEAYRWVMPYLTTEEPPEWVHNWILFKEEFKKTFSDVDIVETSRQKIKTLRQTGAATSYAVEFRRYAAYLIDSEGPSPDNESGIACT